MTRDASAPACSTPVKLCAIANTATTMPTVTPTPTAMTNISALRCGIDRNDNANSDAKTRKSGNEARSPDLPGLLGLVSGLLKGISDIAAPTGEHSARRDGQRQGNANEDVANHKLGGQTEIVKPKQTDDMGHDGARNDDSSEQT